MTEHYVRTAAGITPDGEPVAPSDPTHYVRIPATDPTLLGMVSAVVWDTGIVRETLQAEAWDETYSPVDMSTDPDQLRVSGAPVVQSPNGSQWAITVDDLGNVVAAQVGGGDG